MTRAEHQAVLRVLRMVDEFLEAQTPQAGADPAVVTFNLQPDPKVWAALRRQVAGAIGIVEAVKPTAPRMKR